MEEQKYGGALLNTEDIRDLPAGLIVSEPSELPESVEFDLKALTTYSQGSTLSCTAQGVTNAIEAQYYCLTGNRVNIDIEKLKFELGKIIDIDAMKQWEYQTQIYPKTSIDGMGDYTRSACRAIKHLSDNNNGIPAKMFGTDEEIRIKVDSYATVVNDPEVFKKMIAQGYAIYTSCAVSKNAEGINNWQIAKDTGVLRIGGRYITGHAFCIVPEYRQADDKYDFPRFRCANSYGEYWGVERNGTFYLPFDEVTSLDTSWMIVLDIDPAKERASAARSYQLNKTAWRLMESNISRGFYADESRTIQRKLSAINQKFRDTYGFA